MENKERKGCFVYLNTMPGIFEGDSIGKVHIIYFQWHMSHYKMENCEQRGNIHVSECG